MDDGKSSDRLRFAIVKDLKIVLCQIADAAAVRVANDDGDEDFVCEGMDGGGWLLLGGGEKGEEQSEREAKECREECW